MRDECQFSFFTLPTPTLPQELFLRGLGIRSCTVLYSFQQHTGTLFVTQFCWVRFSAPPIQRKHESTSCEEKLAGSETPSIFLPARCK